MKWQWCLCLLAVTSIGCADPATDDDDDDDEYSGLIGTGSGNSFGSAPADLAGNGYSVGSVAYNMTMIDQHGNDVELYDYYGQVILLDVFAEW